LALPFYGALTERDVDRVCTTLERILDKTLVRGTGRF
jgi:dTDP-4-amino-4,6-dideoxygalactose transaminase